MEARMFFLPKGSPLFENQAIAKLGLPDILTKLRSAGFSGYVSFQFPASTIIMLFESGKLAAALHAGVGGTWQTGPEVLATLAELMLSAPGGTMNGYRLSPRLCACVWELLGSTVIYRAQELKLLNIKGLLHQISSERITGCLRTYTDERSSLIFYRDGKPLGFFHDGSVDLETSTTESQQVASLAGAKIDLYATREMEEPLEHDLFDEVAVRGLWNGAVARHRNGRAGGK
jgi:hypothetical protein